MQFFIQRMVEKKQVVSQDDFIFSQVIREYPEVYHCALLTRDYIKNLLQEGMSNDELLCPLFKKMPNKIPKHQVL